MPYTTNDVSLGDSQSPSELVVVEKFASPTKNIDELRMQAHMLVAIVGMPGVSVNAIIAKPYAAEAEMLSRQHTEIISCAVISITTVLKLVAMQHLRLMKDALCAGSKQLLLHCASSLSNANSV